jgi:tetratricopeptide (TPR) repeat protein
MRSPAFLWRLVAASCVLVCLAAVASADVIVLKNGRRITAVNVREADGKVVGETSAGTVTLPSGMVERIERDGAAGSPAAELRWGPPGADLSGSSSSAQPVVRGNSIDLEALQRVRREAARGDAAAAARAAEAESAVSALEFNRGNLDEALVHAERALAFQPSKETMLLNVAYLRLRRSEYTAALTYLDRARRVAPDSPETAKLAGWAYYGLNRLPQAADEWRRSLHLRPDDPDDEVAAALAKVERDLEAERNFREDGSEHFVLLYDGAATPELARAILRELEEDLRAASAALDYSPSAPVSVVLYTSQAFADITRAPAWAGAINDGRIRIPVQGLTSVTPALARVLRHELAHSLIAGKTRGRCPVWLHEGVAQWMDGSRIGPASAASLVALYDRHEDPSLTSLEGPWMNMPKDYVGTAYIWALAVVEAMVNEGGTSEIARLLDRVASGIGTEAAARAALRLDYTGLNRLAVEYLRKNYLR